VDRTLRRVLHHRFRDFEDLMQNTFVQVLRAVAEDRFEGRSGLETWASAIATHVALDAVRAAIRERTRHVDLPEGTELPAAGRPESRLEAAAELRRLQGILSRMKPDLAETLVLHDVLGHALEEIAEMRGVGVAATQSRLHRARLELRRRAAPGSGGRTRGGKS
jgi:RNA polymerase sigma-70 factor (ECF subfamily)